MFGTACARTNWIIWGKRCDPWLPPQYGETCPSIPKAAYKACAGKKEGDAASYLIAPNFENYQGETINGVCQADYKGNLAVKRKSSQN